MERKKLKLKNLQVNSFITTLSEDFKKTAIGGIAGEGQSILAPKQCQPTGPKQACPSGANNTYCGGGCPGSIIESLSICISSECPQNPSLSICDSIYK